MMFMAKGNIARTAEAMKLSGVSVHRALHTLEEGWAARCLFTKGAIYCRCRRRGRCWSTARM
jgi:LysR family malonate utilization transcriptional regulator